MKWFLSLLAFFIVALSTRDSQGGDVTTREARNRFREGVALYDQELYEAASAKFKQAYALRPHPDVLLNIGWSELRAGHRDEARSAFNDYLHESKNVTSEKRLEAQRGLDLANEAHVDPGSSPNGENRPDATRSDVYAEVAPAEHALRADALLGFGSNNLGLNLGARAGKIAFSRVYVGGTFVYCFGHTVSVGTPNGTAAESSYSAFYLGPEGGYELDFDPIKVRPYGGIGMGSFTASASVAGGPSASASHTEIVFWTGATALYDVPRSAFTVGADTRLAFVPGGGAFGAFVTGGMRF